ncbi:hypothetical protein [Streptomyces sp. NRRL F-5135]|uniref:hypothetical protein n=1 Tax=Streptomyces sp. NRRL F-5135 TaxID=1463858 RepID=UPI0004C69AB4|nr:hypothetical protein [Streptomyces sp. NRRL F-5135]
MTGMPPRGAWGWLRALFGGRRQSVLSFESMTMDVPETAVVHRDSVVSFETPARGDGFDFQVEIRCEWCAEGRLDQEVLGRAIDGYQADMPQRLTERVRDITRLYEPFRAEEAELAVNDALREGECFENGLVRCRTVAFLRPAPEVLEQQRKAALELQDIEHRYAKSALQVELLTQVSERWRTFLAEGLVGTRQNDDSLSWLTPWAVLLAEQPDRAATEVGDMFQQRRGQLEDFLKFLEQQVKAHQAHDVFDFVVTNEHQLGRAMRMFGLPLPGDLASGSGEAEPLPQPSRN